jgi:hypothetical protein
MEKYFNCFNCKELINIVFESKCCGILYCHNCKSKLINTQCLKCDKPLELQRNMFAQRLLKNINVKCKYGCGTTLTYDKMKEHLLICDKKIYICSFDNIKNDGKDEKVFKGYKKEMIDHMVKQHPKILLFFMENSKTFQKQIDKILNKNIDKMNDDTILNISNNLNNSLLINDENEENTHIEFEHDMQLLNRINDLNLINSNINNFNDLRINNGTNNNIPSFRINNSYQENNNNNNNNALNNMINSFINSEGNDSIDNNNNIRLLDSNIHRNNLNSLRELSYNSNSNDNVNVNLIYRLNQNNNINNNSNHSDDNS